MADETIDLRPRHIDVLGVAGDSVNFNVVAADFANIAGAVFTAQVRDATGAVVEAFTVTGITDGVNVWLEPDQTRTLFNLLDTTAGGVVKGAQPQVREPDTWTGKYDVQVAWGPGQVRTLIYGKLTLQEDVTQ